MKEETNLGVAVDRLILEEAVHPDGGYKRRRTYLCYPVSGEASPGFEPEPLAASNYSISEVRWFDLRDESGWDEELRQDPTTYPQLAKLRDALGYEA